MDDGIKCESVPPGVREIMNSNVRIPVSSFLRPAQQGLFGVGILLSNNNIRYLNISVKKKIPLKKYANNNMINNKYPGQGFYQSFTIKTVQIMRTFYYKQLLSP